MLGNSANDTRRQENDGGHKRQRAAYSDSEEAEGKENKPNKRIQDQSSQRQRPAKHEQQAPEEEFNHTRSHTQYEDGRNLFPGLLNPRGSTASNLREVQIVCS